MNDEYKKSKTNLVGGAPLVVEDLNVTMKVVTYQGPVFCGFWKRLKKNLTCWHDMSGKWFKNKYCVKCGLIKNM